MRRVVFHYGLHCISQAVWSLYALSHQCNLFMLWVTSVISECFESTVWSLYALSHQCDLFMLWVTSVISECFESTVWSLYALNQQSDLCMLWVTGVISECFESPVWSQNALCHQCDLRMLWPTSVISVCFESPVWYLNALSQQCDLRMLWVTSVTSECHSLKAQLWFLCFLPALQRRRWSCGSSTASCQAHTVWCYLSTTHCPGRSCLLFSPHIQQARCCKSECHAWEGWGLNSSGFSLLL